MLSIELTESSGAVRLVTVPDDCVIGKAAHNELRLGGWRIAKEHARLFSTPSGVLLEDMGAYGGVAVNGRRIGTQYGPLAKNDVIAIGAYSLRVLPSAAKAQPSADDASRPQSPRSPIDAAEAAEAAAAGMGASTAGTPSADRAPIHHTDARPPSTPQSVPMTDRSMPAPNAQRPLAASHVAQAAHAANAEHQRLEFEWRGRLHARLLEAMDLRRRDVHSMSDAALRSEAASLIRDVLAAAGDAVPAVLDRDLLCAQVLNEAIGLGPLEDLLSDESVSEIMVNRYDEIYVERAGRLQRHPLTFTGDRAVMGVIERIVAPLGRRIDESSPMVDARLKDGSRVNAIIPPLAVRGPCLTIRKFARRKLTSDDLVQFGSIDAAMGRFLELCVVARKNIIVSGGTGSGKTTLLNILSNAIPASERVITVEDAAELQLHHAHLISLEARPANGEGKGAVQIRDLVRNTLRMRPDRIVVGECRGAEALDMLQAMNTGHEGSLTSLHANAPRDALARLETMVLMAGMDLPLQAIREQIASAVDILVQQTRFACGARLVTSITEVTGMESGKIQLQEIFRFQQQGTAVGTGRVSGYFTGCDMVPSFYDGLRASGLALDVDLFKPAQPPADRSDRAAG